MSGQAGERGPAVVGDHVGERSRDVDARAARGAAELGIGAVQVADDPLRVGPSGEPAQIRFAGGRERGQPGVPAAGRDATDEPEIIQRGVDGPGTLENRTAAIASARACSCPMIAAPGNRQFPKV